MRSPGSSTRLLWAAILPWALLPTPAAALDAPWWDDAWGRRVPMTLDNSAQAEELTDFPVRVRLDGARVAVSFVAADGADLRFVTDAGEPLAYEIERWDPAGDSELWVKIPTLPAGDTTRIWLYHDNPEALDASDSGAVWSNSYQLVLHLTYAGAIAPDSGPIGLTVDDRGTTGVVGTIGGARTFGEGMYLEARTSLQAALGHSATLTYWARTTAPDGCVAGYWELLAADYLYWGCVNGFVPTGHAIVAWEFDLAASPDRVNTGLWVYGAHTRDQATGRLQSFTNGVAGGAVSSRTGPLPRNFDDIGQMENDSQNWHFDGELDEIRIADVVRSEAWIAAQYLSQADFLVQYGTAELRPDPPEPGTTDTGPENPYEEPPPDDTDDRFAARAWYCGLPHPASAIWLLTIPAVACRRRRARSSAREGDRSAG